MNIFKTYAEIDFSSWTAWVIYLAFQFLWQPDVERTVLERRRLSVVARLYAYDFIWRYYSSEWNFWYLNTIAKKVFERLEVLFDP